jgi:hypothetical protein
MNRLEFIGKKFHAQSFFLIKGYLPSVTSQKVIFHSEFCNLNLRI